MRILEQGFPYMRQFFQKYFDVSKKSAKYTVDPAEKTCGEL